jgi:hypothetical protein
MTQPIAVSGRRRHKQAPIEVTVTRVTFREVSCIALDQIFLGYAAAVVSAE